jgi:hypothetical protein
MVQSQPRQIVHKSLKYPTQKRAGGVAQMVECLSSKHEDLNSTPVPKKGKKEKRNRINPGFPD